VDWVLRTLLSNTKVARATHNIIAYRFQTKASDGVGGDEFQVADNDDDGEDGAGSKLAQLLDTMQVRTPLQFVRVLTLHLLLTQTTLENVRWTKSKANNVLVVVSRWYGGIHLGPDRFRLINNSAREVMMECGFGQQPGGVKAKGRHKKKKK